MSDPLVPEMFSADIIILFKAYHNFRAAEGLPASKPHKIHREDSQIQRRKVSTYDRQRHRILIAGHWHYHRGIYYTSDFMPTDGYDPNWDYAFSGSLDEAWQFQEERENDDGNPLWYLDGGQTNSW